ncbi:MAG: hypothetical protein P0111_14380 [Nitrospira sp.]|nr:hypothetical protein [Nitrospira sp.]
MPSPVATYTFLPWLRQGIANQIQGGATAVRAKIKVQLDIAGTGIGDDEHTPVERDVSLYGPGDIVGIDPKAIIRVEPRNWITNFEPNYLPFIEFYDEDFPWRYTPAPADTGLHRLTPWIALLVLEEATEFEDGKNIQNRPLPFITIKGDLTKLLPRHDELWAWAHVHVNQALHAGAEVVAPDTGAALSQFESILRTNTDMAYSRLMSPRDLAENKTYHAFVVPAFETGRRAGLNLDIPPDLDAAAPAWGGAARPEAGSFPYYFRWQFRTGAMGDFEFLVRLLKPRPMDVRVGLRDMDVQNPGASLPNLGMLNDILRLGGALRVPYSTLKPEDKAEFDKYDRWATPPANPYPQPFQGRLAALLNLADDYAATSASAANAGAGLPPIPADDSDDPVVTPPVYGRWHAAVSRVLKERGGSDVAHNRNWLHELNLDPRYRVASGFGTRVVQDNQETYMDKAWEQLGDVLEANRRLRRGQFALAVGKQWHAAYVKSLAEAHPEKLILFTGAVQRRIVGGGVTLGYRVSASPLTRTAISAPFRKSVRSGSRAMKLAGLGALAGPAAQGLLQRWNNGDIAPAAPKSLPPSLPTIDQVARQVEPRGAPAWLLPLLRRYAWLPWIPLGIGLLILLLLVIVFPPAAAVAVGGLAVGAGYYGLQIMRSWRHQTQVADMLGESGRAPEAVDELPKSPDFHLSQPGSGFRPGTGDVDSPEATNFKTALRGLFTFQQTVAAAPRPPEPVRLDVTAFVNATVLGTEPARTLPPRVWSQIAVPGRIAGNLVFDFDDIMEYPKIDLPMYEPLRDISPELFLPNIHLIEQNTISLLETNQKFIESYMVGVNHEFARELLWREFPTDQRGSYFRQFWDVRAYLDPHDPKAQQRREQLFDIEEIHKWPKDSELGRNDPKDATAPPREEVVLVIRGELLKRYPNAVIYAHRADWRRVGDRPSGAIDRGRPRVLVEIPASEEENPPRDKVKTPLYSAQVYPDIYFFGFDLTIDDAKGETPTAPDDPGWFFVIKERPGEPRFGLDEGNNNVFRTWNDLGWGDVQEQDSTFLRAAQNDLHITPPGADDPQGILQQAHEDDDIRWTNVSNAADIAYVLYQVPVLVAVHGSEMLPR